MYAIDVRTPLTYKGSRSAIPRGRRPHPGSAPHAMKSEIVCFDQMLANVRTASARAGTLRRAPRGHEVNALTVKRLRGWTQLSQADFARLLGVELSTLRNWEQGRREPTGPARALLRAIATDPEHVLRALGSGGAPRAAVLRRREATA
jgi:putative transcriptional regulator